MATMSAERFSLRLEEGEAALPVEPCTALTWNVNQVVRPLSAQAPADQRVWSVDDNFDAVQAQVPPVAKKTRKKRRSQNFERSVAPRKWLAQPSDFGKTRFRRFPTFHFSTLEKKTSGFLNDFQQFLHVFCIMLKTYTFLSVSGIYSMKNYTMWTKYHLCTKQ